MSTTKMQLLAEELLTRSKAGDIGWHRSSHESAYLLHFPDLFLIIRQRNDGDYELEVGDESRGGVEALVAKEGDNLHSRLAEIYSSADTSVREAGVNKALEYIRGAKGLANANRP